MTATRRFTAACVQTTTGTDMDANLAAAAEGVRRAVDRGAAFVATPECVSMLVMGRQNALAAARAEAAHSAIPAFADLARETGAVLLAGSLSILRDDGRIANRSFLFGADGTVLARFDKIHMYDVDLPNGERYRESSTYAPGTATVVAETPLAAFGLTVCYDMRFPHLYRDLARAGAEVITVRRPLPDPPAGPIGRCCCAPGRSNPAVSSLRPRRPASTPAAGRPGGIR